MRIKRSNMRRKFRKSSFNLNLSKYNRYMYRLSRLSA